MSSVENFLTLEEEQDIIAAIRTAERNTSGEIRVHIEATANTNAFDRAVEVFHMLKMFNTKAQNAVLIYVAVEDHRFVIYGDDGINAVVPDNFWETTKDAMQSRFRRGNFAAGIIAGVLKAGEELKTHFPWQIDDEDELSNEISKG